MAEYFYISLFAVVALVVVGALLTLSTVLGPRNPSAQKMLPYECGIIPTEEAKGRYPVRFATIAMLFIIFDVEVVFMYPWAVALGELGLFGLLEMAIFIVILGVAYVYIWGRGGLEWD
jgi:NADH-quinone oxidoreductase subunit A